MSYHSVAHGKLNKFSSLDIKINASEMRIYTINILDSKWMVLLNHMLEN